jgi:hypothetical protein
MDFFNANTDNPDDIQARDFLPNWEAIASGIGRPATYMSERTHVHKLAAHLTYTRVALASQKEPPRPTREMTDFLLGQAALFIRSLPDERVVWFGGL